MKVEVGNAVGQEKPLLRDLDAGECAWIQLCEDDRIGFNLLVMVINVEYEGKSYVCLENGFSRPVGNEFMNYPCIPVKVKVVRDI